MKDTNIESKQKMLEKYYGQKSKLPSKVVELVNKKIVFYALSDLDTQFNFFDSWVILTNKNLFLVTEQSDKTNESMTIIDINQISRIAVSKHLSFTSYIFVQTDDDLPLGKISFSNRQQSNMAQLKYLIEKKN